MANEANITAVDLFAGCGGMSLGFEKAGVDVVAAYDNWDAAIDVYRANFEHPVFKRDLSDVSVAEEVSSFSPDIIIGGPPCQDFSQAGKRSEDGGACNPLRSICRNHCEVHAAIHRHGKRPSRPNQYGHARDSTHTQIARIWT